MKFLLDANMPRSVIAVCKARGHDAIHVADEGMGSAPDDEIAAFARSGGRVLLTRDLDFSDIRTYPPQNTPGIVVLRVPDTAVAGEIARLVDSFLAQKPLVEATPGRLAILEPDRVRFRPRA
ncbi:MAG: DUF5615 family PIN-like protein [Vicinamibacteria bacterium]